MIGVLKWEMAQIWSCGWVLDWVKTRKFLYLTRTQRGLETSVHNWSLRQSLQLLIWFDLIWFDIINNDGIKEEKDEHWAGLLCFHNPTLLTCILIHSCWWIYSLARKMILDPLQLIHFHSFIYFRFVELHFQMLGFSPRPLKPYRLDNYLFFQVFIFSRKFVYLPTIFTIHD